MNHNIKHALTTTLQSFKNGNLTDCALSLFQTLCYNTSRQAPLSNPTYAEFYDSYAVHSPRFREDKAYADQWEYVDLLFQLSADELRSQLSIFDTTRVDDTIIESYLFFVIGLSESTYTRTSLSQITREVNKLFPMPVMILFKHGNNLSLAVIDRRIHKKDEQKDVLKKVTLIKDIQTENTHRAHLEILTDLSFPELASQYTITNFVELHNAWQKTLDTKELNNRFFKELSNWYFWAMQVVSFPDAVEKNAEIRNATNLIRLITRIIFVWFIKEKALVPHTLFQASVLKKILKDFNKNNKSHSYYRAILQNLFFGVLNQKMDKRKFAKDEGYPKNRSEYGVKTLLRYESLFKISQEEVLNLFKDVPFLNGGLFDCLDKEDENGKVLYVDGFSRNTKKQAVVPDYLFFGGELDIDLNSIYGTKNKSYKTKGLFEILYNYKFTVTENTPIEEEVALDPELLGKVFENLLASYNPETKTNARKQTGSFYTPREIVHYMVDESLIAYLMQKLDEAGYPDREEDLRELLSYTETPNPFNEAETAVLIKAIDDCKILDPACGSGAFPMGILHKLVHILHKLDPQNELWKERQIEKTQALEDAVLRDKSISNIEEAFANNELDYGRKLYLIENCIYGVDIQPIAVQIAKLRFFISLIIDQQKQPERDNLGIQSLPNLETKFVAANTLIPLGKPEGQISIFTYENPEIETLKDKLKQIRHRYFNAKTRNDKLRYQKQDKSAREKLAQYLMKDGWSEHTVQQLVVFDPYDQNASAPFFDPEWMFGLSDGFDIVIGNPPYVDSENMVKNYYEFRILLKKLYGTAKGNWDLFVVFIERGIMLSNTNGTLSYIVPNKLISSKYAETLREYISNFNIKEIIDYSNVSVFKEADVYPIVIRIVVNNKKTFVTTKIMDELEYVNHINMIGEETFYADNYWDKFFFDNNVVQLLIKLSNFEKLKDKKLKILGSATVNEAYKIKEVITEWDNQNDIKRLINTGTIDPFESLWGKKKTRYIKNDYIRPVVKDEDIIKINKTRFSQAKLPKIILAGMSLKIEAFYDELCHYLAGKSTIIIMGSTSYLAALTAILNSTLISFWFSKHFNSLSMSGGYFNIGTDHLQLIPIANIEQENTLNILHNLTLIIQFLKMNGNNNCANFFIQLTNAIIYELYLSDEIKKASCNVLKHLNNLTEYNNSHIINIKLQAIIKIYQEYSNPSHPVNTAIEKMKEIPEIKIIEGRE